MMRHYEIVFMVTLTRWTSSVWSSSYTEFLPNGGTIAVKKNGASSLHTPIDQTAKSATNVLINGNTHASTAEAIEELETAFRFMSIFA